MLQVHKESIHKVPNAISGREDPDMAVHGLDGVPFHLLMSKARGTQYEVELLQKKALESAAEIPPQQTTYLPTWQPIPGMYPPYFPISFPGMPMSGMIPPFSSGLIPPPQTGMIPAVPPPSSKAPPPPPPPTRT